MHFVFHGMMKENLLGLMDDCFIQLWPKEFLKLKDWNAKNPNATLTSPLH